jgi:hypothetical protein
LVVSAVAPASAIAEFYSFERRATSATLDSTLKQIQALRHHLLSRLIASSQPLHNRRVSSGNVLSTLDEQLQVLARVFHDHGFFLIAQMRDAESKQYVLLLLLFLHRSIS